MYQTEEFKSRTTIKDYLKNYINGESFLEYCEKYTGCGQIWSCPLYDFNPAAYERNFKYFHIIGKRIIFDRVEISEARVRKSKREKEQKDKERKERDRYVNQVCLREKNLLSEKVQALEKKYPGSIGLTAGSCHMCRQCIRPQDDGCRYSDEIRYFLESLGANVGETAGELLGLELQWMKEATPGYYTLIHVFLTDNAEVEL